MRADSTRLPAGTTVLAPALVVAGALGYAVFVGAGRLLGPADFAVFAAYWGLLFGAGGMLAATEQETARLVVRNGRRTTPRLQRRLVLSSLMTALGMIALGASTAPLTVHKVLHGKWPLFCLVALAVLGFGVQFVVRGCWLGLGRTRMYAALVVLEAFIRAAVLLAVVVLGSRSVVACAAAVTAGSFAWLLGLRSDLVAPPRVPTMEPQFGVVLSKVLRLVLAAAFSSAVVTGYPALASAVAPASSRHELGVLIASLTVTRLPLLLLGPVQALLVPEFVEGLQRGGWRATRRLIALLAGGVLASGTALALLAIPLGASVLSLLYGDAYRVRGGTLAAMTLGATLVAMLLVIAAALVGLDAHGWVAAVWGLCFVVLLIALISPYGSLTDRVVISLISGPAAGLGLAMAAVRTLGRRSSIAYRTRAADAD